MASKPTYLDFTQETPNAAAGDTLPNSSRGLSLFPSGGTWYSKDESGNVEALAGVQSVSSGNSGITIGGTATAPSIALATILLNYINNFFSKSVYNILDFGVKFDGSTDDTAAWTAAFGSIPDRATIQCPPATSLVSGALSIPAGKHFRIKGAGPNGKTIIQTSSATADIFDCGDWYDEFEDLTFTSSVAKTAGSAINSGSDVGVTVRRCSVGANMFNGFVYSGGAQAGNLAYVQDCIGTGHSNFFIQINGTNANSIISGCTANNSPAPVANLELNALGSVLVNQCDFIGAVNNVRINPASGSGIFAAYFDNCFFDNSAGSGVKLTGAGVIQRLKFSNCYITTASGQNGVGAIEFANTGATPPSDISLIDCSLYNTYGSTSSSGILSTNAVLDFQLIGCQVSGYTTGVGGASTGASKISLIGNRIGPEGGIGADTTGVAFAAGTYASITLLGNDLSGNTTPLSDSAAVTNNQRNYANNVGLNPIPVALSAASSGITNTETVVESLYLPAGSLQAGTTLKIKAFGQYTQTGTAAVANVLRARIGTAGTTADAIIVPITGTSNAAASTAIPFELEVLVSCRSVGSAGQVVAFARLLNSGVTGISATTNVVAPAAAAPAAGTGLQTVNTTVANYLDLTAVSGATTSTITFHVAVITVERN